MAYQMIEPTSDQGLINLGLEWSVYGYDKYPESSVLAGQRRRMYLNSFSTVEDAAEAYPDAELSQYSGKFPVAEAPVLAPEWFDELDAGEVWGENDY